MTEKRWNNKGFTLFELIVVMAIIAILTGIISFSIAYINNTNVTAAANRLNSVINTARVKSMTQGPENGRIRLYYQDGDLYAQIGENGGPELISSSQIGVTCLSGNYNVGTGGTVIPACVGEIWFKSSGAVDTVKTTLPVSKFDFHKGNKHVQVILYAETGKHSVAVY